MKRSCKRSKATLVVPFFAVLVFSTAVSAAEIRIAALVNQDVITTYDMDQARAGAERPYSLRENAHALDPRVAKANVGSEDSKALVNQLINRRLLEQEMDRLGITVTEAEVNAEWSRMSGRIGGSSGIESELARQGLSVAEYRRNLADHLRLLKFIGRRIRSKVSIDDVEVRAAYDRAPDQYRGGERFRLLQIEVPGSRSRSEVMRLASSIASGPVEAGIDATRKTLGAKGRVIDIGLVQADDLASRARQVIVGLRVGDVSAPVAFENQWLLFRVLGKEAGAVRPYEEVREEIRYSLFEQAIDQELTHSIAELRRQGLVEVRI